jgi:hypothetical protein
MCVAYIALIQSLSALHYYPSRYMQHSHLTGPALTIHPLVCQVLNFYTLGAGRAIVRHLTHGCQLSSYLAVRGLEPGTTVSKSQYTTTAPQGSIIMGIQTMSAPIYVGHQGNLDQVFTGYGLSGVTWPLYVGTEML